MDEGILTGILLCEPACLLIIHGRQLLMIAQREYDVDGCIDFDGLVVEQVGAVAPTLHCIERGLAEHWVAGDDAEVFDDAGFGDRGREGDGS